MDLASFIIDETHFTCLSGEILLHTNMPFRFVILVFPILTIGILLVGEMRAILATFTQPQFLIANRAKTNRTFFCGVCIDSISQVIECNKHYDVLLFAKSPYVALFCITIQRLHKIWG